MLAKRGLVGCGCVERQRGKEAIMWRFGARGGGGVGRRWLSGIQALRAVALE